MNYFIDESLSDTEFTSPANSPAAFGTPRIIESIGIHHWGAFGQTHDGVLDFFLNRNDETSAHFVVSDSRINCLVSPANAAWAAGNAYGNATAIHIECRPEATDGDYSTVAWLISWIRENYGDLPLIPHNAWTKTACPGIWDLSRLDSLARSTPDPSETPREKDNAMTPDDKTEMFNGMNAAADRVGDRIGTETANIMRKTDEAADRVGDRIGEETARLAAAIDSLATKQDAIVATLASLQKVS